MGEGQKIYIYFPFLRLREGPILILVLCLTISFSGSQKTAPAEEYVMPKGEIDDHRVPLLRV